MNRRKFIKKCGMACLAGLAFKNTFLNAATANHKDNKEESENLKIPIRDFIKKKKKNKTIYRDCLILYPEAIAYPIVVFRRDFDDYKAFLLQCTHQGNTLQVFGDLIECPAHGSEFNAKGEVLEGPATAPLKEFKTKIENDYLKIYTT